MPHPPTVPRRLSAVLAAVVLAVLALTATTVQAKPKAAPKVVGESTTFTLAPAVRDRIAALEHRAGRCCAGHAERRSAPSRSRSRRCAGRSTGCAAWYATRAGSR